MIKPQLAEDAILEDVKFPVIAQPKVDGVRAWKPREQLLGRSMDPFTGLGITQYFDRPIWTGFDGEMTLGSCPWADGLCRLTTGAMTRFKDVTEMADLHWWVFDLVRADTVGLPYQKRYDLLQRAFEKVHWKRVHLMPAEQVRTRDQLHEIIASHSDNGYEGTILRNPHAVYKEGRATKRHQELWRVKLWDTFEIRVTEIIEGQSNQNEAKKNTLGKTERSSAKDGMVPNGQVGSIKGPLLKDLRHPLTKKLILPKGTVVTGGAGEMTIEQAIYYFKNQDKLLNQIATIKYLPHGTMNKPRMPTFKSVRAPADWDKT